MQKRLQIAIGPKRFFMNMSGEILLITINSVGFVSRNLKVLSLSWSIGELNRTKPHTSETKQPTNIPASKTNRCHLVEVGLNALHQRPLIGMAKWQGVWREKVWRWVFNGFISEFWIIRNSQNHDWGCWDNVMVGTNCTGAGGLRA
jgi:hypothetical protein